MNEQKKHLTQGALVLVRLSVPGGTIRFKIKNEMLPGLKKQIKETRQGWMPIITSEGDEIEIRASEVFAIQSKDFRVKKSRTSGVTIKEIGEATGIAYHTLRRKLKDLSLDLASDRRVILSAENVKKLNLAPDEVERLRKFENQRTRGD